MPSSAAKTGSTSAAPWADRAVARVEHRQQLLDERLGGAVDVIGLLLHHPLAVVLEVGLGAAQRVEVLVALARRALEVGDRPSTLS